VRLPVPLFPALLVTALASGCGSSDKGAAPPPQPEPAAKPSDFPAAKGKALNALASMTQGQGPVLSPSVSIMHKGVNRYGFALFDSARKQITGAPVALYTALQDGTGARGPYVARSESLAVKSQFQSQTTASDPDAAKAVYVADVPLPRDGKHVIMAMTKVHGHLVVSDARGVDVTSGADGPPDVGDRAIKVHTETLSDVAGDAAQLDTRRPAAKDLLQTDLADVLGKQPVVITFATPLLCQSRVCGPVVDVVEQAKANAPKGVAFIHQEIYNENNVEKGVRPQVAAWRLQSEPWTFVIDRGGRISARFEGAFSAGELERAVAKVSSAA